MKVLLLSLLACPLFAFAANEAPVSANNGLIMTVWHGEQTRVDDSGEAKLEKVVCGSYYGCDGQVAGTSSACYWHSWCN